MNHYLKYGLLLLVMSLSHTSFAAPLINTNSFWECATRDSSDTYWSAKNAYRKAALNIAFAACKKQSKNPSSCKTSVANCEGFNQEISNKPMWQCTALDEAAASWESNFYSQRDDAALGAKAFCKDKSSVPDTCYINMVTCTNFNDGVQL